MFPSKLLQLLKRCVSLDDDDNDDEADDDDDEDAAMLVSEKERVSSTTSDKSEFLDGIRPTVTRFVPLLNVDTYHADDDERPKDTKGCRQMDFIGRDSNRNRRRRRNVEPVCCCERCVASLQVGDSTKVYLYDDRILLTTYCGSGIRESYFRRKCSQNTSPKEANDVSGQQNKASTDDVFSFFSFTFSRLHYICYFTLS